MPFGDYAYNKQVNLSELANALVNAEVDSDNILSIFGALSLGTDEYDCESCGVSRPTIEVDGLPTCLVCKTSVEREYQVRVTVTFSAVIYVRATGEADAETKAREAFDNGDTSVGDDMDDAEMEIDSVEVSW